MQVIKISKLVTEMKPMWKDFIISLGYNSVQGGKFADGYAAKVATLPTLEKLRALANKHDSCMTAGFEAAGIDEDEAFKRSKKPRLTCCTTACSVPKCRKKCCGVDSEHDGYHRCLMHFDRMMQRRAR